MQKSKIVGVLLTTGILLAFIAIIIITLNPFKTIPRINVLESYWKLGKEGYILHLEISTTAPVQLLGVDVGGSYYDVVYDVKPPQTTLEIPTKNIASEVKLHFNVGSPKTVYPRNMIPSTNIRVIYGKEHLFLVGRLSEPATVVVIPIATKSKVLVVTAPNEAYAIEFFVKRFMPEFKGRIIEANHLNMSILNNYTTIIFVDIMPEPKILDMLLRERKAVVAYVSKRVLGELRFDIAKNGTVEIKRYPPDDADIDYIGAHCVLYKHSYITKTGNDLLNSLIKIYGGIEFNYIISPSSYCRREVLEVYAQTELGEVVIGRLRSGIYFVSSQSRILLTLANIGFFEAKNKKVFIAKVNPFQGIKPLPPKVKEKAYLVSILTRKKIYTFYVQKPPASYNLQKDMLALEVGILNKRAVLTGSHRVRVEEYTYDYNLLRVVMDKNMTLPSSFQIHYTPFHAYIVYIDGKPELVVADETIINSKPSIAIEYSTICELFSLKVIRNDNVPSPLILSINGKDVFVLDNTNRKYELYKCKLGYFDVIVKDAYGRIIRRVKFQVVHIYETPFFILAVLSAGATVSTFIYVTKRREEKEVEEIRMIFYKLPEIERRTINEYVVEETISRLSAAQKLTPTVQAVIHDLYKKHPLLKIVNEIVMSMRDLLASKKATMYGMYSRYVPELDDTITLIGLKKNLKKDFYNHVIIELLKKFGGVSELGEEQKEIVDVDMIVFLGKKMLLLTYAPTSKSIRDAIDRGLTSFMKIRRFKLPFSLIGLAIVTEPKYVKPINDIIDRILSQDQETASKILRDMTIYTQHICIASREAWLSKYIIVAVPITRIAPLIAFAKTGAVRLCNKYYRYTSFL